LVALLGLLAIVGCSKGAGVALPEGSSKFLYHPEFLKPIQGMPKFKNLVGELGAKKPLGEKAFTETRPGFKWQWLRPLVFSVELPLNPVLAFGWGFSDEALNWGKEFKLSVTVTQGETREVVKLIEERMLPEPDGSPWREEKIDLSRFESARAEIEFAFEGLAPTQAEEGFLLSSPRVYSSGRTSFRRIILIGVDTLRADHLSCYGYNRDTSPNLDKWAEGGTLFEYCISASPWTYPSFSAMLTGRYPSVCGAVTNVKFLPSDEMTLAEILSREGFATFMVVNNIWTGPPVNLDQGFDAAIRLPVERADVTFATAQDWLKSHQDEDTFVFIHFMDTHVPYHPPQPFNDMFDEGYSGKYRHEFKEVEEVRSGELQLTDNEINHLKALYDGELAYLDSEFGKFLEFLKGEGMDEETLFIFSADHGEEFFEHGGFEHGHSLYDEVIWVPLIVCGPDLPEGKVDGRLASTMDVFPTVLEYIGINVPDNINGLSLLKPLPEEERLLVAEQLLYGEELRGITTPEYRYIYHTVTGEEELYDLSDDRLMLRSVAADRRAAARSFRAFLTSYTIEMGSPWHINFMRTGKKRISAAYSGTITSPGGFAKVDKLRFDDDDTLEVDGDTIKFKVTVPRATEKEIDFVTNDESAEVTFEIRRNGTLLNKGDIYIGPGMDKVDNGLFALNVNDERFSLGQPNLQRENHEGVFIWAIPTHFREQMQPELTPEMVQQLRSIGYLH
jgi:arylsulfatase A-like enzyme